MFKIQFQIDSFKLFSAIFFLSLFLILPSFCFAGDVFPNHFKEMVRPLGPAEDTRAVEAKVEQVLSKILERLEIPYIDDEGDEKKGPALQTRGFFHKLQGIADRQKPPGAQVMIAGGVLRSLLGYIYAEVHRAKLRDKTKSTIDVLDAMIASDRPIEIPEALGIGSDLDILIVPSKEGTKTDDALKHKVLEFINSAEKAASSLFETKGKLKYSIVPIGDVKDYSEQLTRTTAQGGSSLDWLAFSIGGGKIKNPDQYPHIFRQFILGTYDYLPPSASAKQGDKAEESDKQTIRGLRALLEIPFLELSEEGQKQLESELNKLLAKIKSGYELSPEAIEQFGKMMRNAQFGGARNRFRLPIPRTPVDALAQEVSQAIKKNEKNLSLIPEFLDSSDPFQREEKSDPCRLREKGLLMKKEDFLAQYTDNGVLYHGTPETDNFLAIVRNGLVRSSEIHGRAAFGSGAYSNWKRQTAAEYGIPIRLEVKKEAPLRIIDWNQVKDLEPVREMVRLEKKHSPNLEFPFQYLAEACGVDFIVNEHVLIQNSGAVELPKKIEDLIQFNTAWVESLVNQYNKDKKLFFQFYFDLEDQIPPMLKAIAGNDALIRLAQQMGKKVLPSPMLRNQVLELLRDSDISTRTSSRDFNLKSSTPAWIKYLVVRGIEGVFTVLEDPHIQIELFNLEVFLLKDFSFHATELLDRVKIENPAVLHEIKSRTLKELRDPNSSKKNEACRRIPLSVLQEDPEIQDAVLDALSDKSPSVRNAASATLLKLEPKDFRKTEKLEAQLLAPKGFSLLAEDGKWLVALASHFKLQNPAIHIAVANLYGSWTYDAKGTIIRALVNLSPKDPRVIEILKPKLLRDIRGLFGSTPPRYTAALHLAALLEIQDRDFHLEMARLFDHFSNRNVNVEDSKTTLTQVTGDLILLKPRDARVVKSLKASMDKILDYDTDSEELNSVVDLFLGFKIDNPERRLKVIKKAPLKKLLQAFRGQDLSTLEQRTFINRIVAAEWTAEELEEESSDTIQFLKEMKPDPIIYRGLIDGLRGYNYTPIVVKNFLGMLRILGRPQDPQMALQYDSALALHSHPSKNKTSDGNSCSTPGQENKEMTHLQECMGKIKMEMPMVQEQPIDQPRR